MDPQACRVFVARGPACGALRIEPQAARAVTIHGAFRVYRRGTAAAKAWSSSAIHQAFRAGEAKLASKLLRASV